MSKKATWNRTLTALLLAPLAALHAVDKPQPAQSQGPTIFVAPGGKDAAAGTQADPLASLAGARDRVRQLKQKGAADKPISVVFADGTYELAEAVVFGPQDSGAEKVPVTYCAEHPCKVILSGGKRVTGWTPKPYPFSSRGVFRRENGVSNGLSGELKVWVF